MKFLLFFAKYDFFSYSTAHGHVQSVCAFFSLMGPQPASPNNWIASSLPCQVFRIRVAVAIHLGKHRSLQQEQRERSQSEGGHQRGERQSK
jgi:hypothetical protein